MTIPAAREFEPEQQTQPKIFHGGILLLLLSLSTVTLGQTPSLMLTTPGQTPTVGSYQTITALVTGVNDKTVTWSITAGSGGALVGNTVCPAGSVNCTIALYSTTATAYTVKAASNANPTVTATATVTFLAEPTPIACSPGAPDTPSCHPRFFVTPSTIATQRAKGVSSNPLYTPMSTQANYYYTTWATTYGFTWSTWSGSACTGGTAPSLASLNGVYIGVAAYQMGLEAELDNSSSNRDKYACAAHDVLLTMIQMFLTNEIPYAWNYPYGIENSAGGMVFVPDMLMSGGYLTSSEMQTVRTYLYALAWDVGQAPNGAGVAMVPSGLNDPTSQFIPTNENATSWQRGTANNYTLTWFEMMAASALTTDDNTTDDPTIPQGQCMVTFVGSGGTGYVTGDTVKLAGGNCVATVHATGGVVDSLTITSPAGGYSGSTNPPVYGQWGTPSSTTTVTGSGSGLTANLFVGNTCGATRGNVCADGTAANMHAYFKLAVGSNLYRWWASAEDPTVVQAAYNAAYSNMPTAPQCNTLWTALEGGTVPCLGVDRGGEAYEGHSYGNSFGTLRDALTFIDTAGYNDPILYGPQMSADTTSVWDLRYIGDLNLMLGMSGVPHDSRWAYLTDGDTNAAIGFATSPKDFTTESSMLLADYNSGINYRFTGEEWMVINSAFGMADGTAPGPGGASCVTSCGLIAELGNDYASPVLPDIFLALPAGNPVTVNPPANPRSAFPTDWYNENNRHIESSSGWTIGANTVFSAFCPDTQADHEHQVCGDYDIYSNGEYITKGRVEFDNYDYGITSMWQENGQSLLQPSAQTTCSPIYPFCTWWSASIGGTFWHGYQSGLNSQKFSQMPNYVATSTDMTKAYNGGWGGYTAINGVTGATRDVLYLRNSNEVITYDRGATGSNSWTKSVSMNTTGTPTISGNTATWLTQSGTQKAAWTNLLPASGTTFAKSGSMITLTLTAPFTSLQVNTSMQATCTATNNDGTTTDVTSNPYVIWYVLSGPATVSSTGLITAGSSTGAVNVYCYYGSQYSDANGTFNVVSGSSSTPTLSASASNSQATDWELMNSVTVSQTTPSWQSLNLLQWGSSSFTPATATAVASSAGQNFDGALIGSTLAMFMRSLGIFTGVTFPASGATAIYVANLSPNATYTVSGTGAPSTCTADNAGTCTFAATGTGNITVGATGVSAPSNLQGVYQLGVITQ